MGQTISTHTDGNGGGGEIVIARKELRDHNSLKMATWYMMVVKQAVSVLVVIRNEIVKTQWQIS